MLRKMSVKRVEALVDNGSYGSIPTTLKHIRAKLRLDGRSELSEYIGGVSSRTVQLLKWQSHDNSSINDSPQKNR